MLIKTLKYFGPTKYTKKGEPIFKTNNRIALCYFLFPKEIRDKTVRGFQFVDQMFVYNSNKKRLWINLNVLTNTELALLEPEVFLDFYL
jgi:hypothetical protein